MIQVYIGIDLASKVSVGAARDAAGVLLDWEEFRTSDTGLISFVKKQAGRAMVLMEECDLAHWARRVLLPHTEEVVICDPKRNRYIHCDSVKDDRIDAGKLAEIALSGTYREVWHEGGELVYSLHAAVKAHEDLVRKSTRQMNQIKARLRREGLITGGRKVFGKRGREEILSQVSDPTLRDILACDYRLLDQLLKERARAKARMASVGRKLPVFSSYLKIPGVGPVVAATFLGYVKCPSRFSSKSQIARFSRLGITRHESGGKPLRGQRLDRRGHGALKDMSRKAFGAAMRSGGDNRFKRAYARTLKNTGDEIHARLTTQREILTVMWAMWRDGTLYDDKHSPEKGA